MTERERLEKWFDDNVNNFPFGSEAERNACKRYADIVWQAATKAAVPEGWKLVPVEPSKDAIYAGVAAWHSTDDLLDKIVQAVYKAMLAAAPEVKDER